MPRMRTASKAYRLILEQDPDTFANLPRHGGRMLILSHREELVEQPRKYFDCSYGIERAQQHSHGEEVVSASIQTLVRRLDQFDPEDFRLIICDEAHHAAASTYRKIFDHFRPEKLIGFTATPNRGDKVRLDTVFSKIIFQRDLRWGVQNGYLCNIHCRRVDIGFDLSAVHTRRGDYAPGELDEAMDGTADAIAEAYRSMAVSLCEDHRQGMTIKVTKGKKPEYSKRLVSDIRSLLWVVTVGGLLLAAYCIHRGYTGSLPWLSAMVGLPWTAHGVVCSFYLNMAKSDHRAGGVTFESAKAANFEKPTGSENSPGI